MHRLALFLAIAFTAHAQEIRRTPLTLKDGGTPEKPAVFDGQGMIIDLGIDVTAHDWEKQGDVWTSRGAFEKHPPVDDVQRAALFIEEVPMRITRDRATALPNKRAARKAKSSSRHPMPCNRDRWDSKRMAQCIFAGLRAKLQAPRKSTFHRSDSRAV